jgi:hypothetical protein
MSRPYKSARHCDPGRQNSGHVSVKFESRAARADRRMTRTVTVAVLLVTVTASDSARRNPSPMLSPSPISSPISSQMLTCQQCRQLRVVRVHAGARHTCTQ